MQDVIVDYLLKRIVEQRFDRDEPLPSEHELAAAFGVSRIVVRRAYERLSDMGYVTSRQGKGRFLRPTTRVFTLDNATDRSFTEKMAELGLRHRTITSCDETTYDRTIWNALELRREQRVFCVTRLRVVEDLASALYRSYVSLDRFPDVAAAGTEIRSMFEYFRAHGFREFRDPSPILSAGLPTASEQEDLACPPLVPVMRVEATTVADGTTVVQFSRITYRSDRIRSAAGTRRPTNDAER